MKTIKYYWHSILAFLELITVIIGSTLGFYYTAKSNLDMWTISLIIIGVLVLILALLVHIMLTIDYDLHAKMHPELSWKDAKDTRLKDPKDQINNY